MLTFAQLCATPMLATKTCPKRLKCRLKIAVLRHEIPNEIQNPPQALEMIVGAAMTQNFRATRLR
jgi:hypothetical protein